MKKYDVVLLTDHRYEQPAKVDWYIEQILQEDQLLISQLENHNLKVIRKNWRSSDFDWSECELAVFRTTWDYFDRFKEFSKWLNVVSNQTNLLNPIELIRWNMDKHYLLDLEEKGINIIPMLIEEAGSNITLKEFLNQSGWQDCVLKPTVSGAGRHTYRINVNNTKEYEHIFSDLLNEEAIILQPFQDNIVTSGEYAFMMINGQFTHAVLKVAKPGDFRVQDDFGGTVHKYKPKNQEIEFAESVFSAMAQTPVYGRVDLIYDNNEQLAVTELELIEPEMWFRLYPPASKLFADAILQLLAVTG